MENLLFNIALVFHIIINLIVQTGNKFSEMEELIRYRKYDFPSLVKEFGIKDNEIDKEVSYIKLKGLSRVHKPDTLPGYFYFMGDKLTMIYINDDTRLGNLSLKKIASEYGEGHRLSSRAGKTSNLYVYPEEGFAISVTHDQIDFIELFPSTTLDDYKSRIHKDVVFIR
ncbi:hypothetical protein Cylst_1922 [Sporocytophaga myxococcoides]|uniref:Uncharacterized protein n=1 Tax=Sporocytophaga myxococcoides TaxID=153721 RepID=A0A098LJJ6_9BACT|nr:hypothetical protein [Sporocytophaga myxococcoides]GAL87145.1 hypothetical protein Cylst_1922 [Sporocytophaga myxococcoides]